MRNPGAGVGSKELGCTSQIEHSIETGDAQPIKINPSLIPHALKPVVDEHIDDMLKRKIIEPSIPLGVAVLFWCKRNQNMELLNTNFV
jgi:hypothetical protein